MPPDGTSQDPDGDGLDQAAIDRAMQEVPNGAIALAGLAIGSLVLAYFLIYFLVFLPRGTVG
jgi:hypothetical protein